MANRKPVINHLGEVFESASAAAEILGCSKSAVNWVCRGKRNCIMGHTFAYYYGNLSDKPKYKSKHQPKWWIEKKRSLKSPI